MLLANFSKMFALKAGKTMTGGNMSRGTSNVDNYYYFPNIQQYVYAWCLDVGFGDTPPTLGDYTLADSNFANRKLTCMSMSGSNGTNSTMIQVMGAFKNEGDSAVTVKEIGLFYATKNYNQTVDQGSILFARSVLDTPVVVGVGETYTFAYSVDIA